MSSNSQNFERPKVVQIRADQILPGLVLTACAHYCRMKVVSIKVLFLDCENPNNSTIRVQAIGADMSTQAATMDWIAHHKVCVENVIPDHVASRRYMEKVAV